MPGLWADDTSSSAGDAPTRSISPAARRNFSCRMRHVAQQDRDVPADLEKSSPHLARLLLGVQPPRRTRHKVQADEYDEQGKRRSEAELRKVKRRITNRESARHMREARQQDMHAVRREITALLSRSARLQAKLTEAQEQQAHVEHQSASWQQLWSAAMASNVRLSRRLSAYERQVGSGHAGAGMSPSAMSGSPAFTAMPGLSKGLGPGSYTSPDTGSIKEECLTPMGPAMHAYMQSADSTVLTGPATRVRSASMLPVARVPGTGMPPSAGPCYMSLRQFSLTPPLLSASFGGPLDGPPAISPIFDEFSVARPGFDSDCSGMAFDGMPGPYMPLM